MPEHCREGRDREAWQADWKAPLRSRRPKHHLKSDETSKAAEAEERSPASGEPSRLPPAQGPDVRGDLWATGSMAWPLALALGFRERQWWGSGPDQAGAPGGEFLAQSCGIMKQTALWNPSNPGSSQALSVTAWEPWTWKFSSLSFLLATGPLNSC